MVEPAPLFGVGVVGDDSGAQVGPPAVLTLLFTVGPAPSAVPGGVDVGGGGAAHLERPTHVWSTEFKIIKSSNTKAKQKLSRISAGQKSHKVHQKKLEWLEVPEEYLTSQFSFFLQGNHFTKEKVK